MSFGPGTFKCLLYSIRGGWVMQRQEQDRGETGAVHAAGIFFGIASYVGMVTRALCFAVLILLAALSPPLVGQSPPQVPTVPINKGMNVQVGKYMEIADNPSLVLHVFTLECWVKAQTRFVIASRDWPGNHLPDWSVVYEGTGRRIEFMTGMNSGPDSYFWTPNNSFPPGVWNHLALVVNGPAGTAKVYINGSLSGSFTFAPRSFTVVTGLAWGGYYQNAGGATGVGIIDEARYWAVERTQSEIQALMNVNIPDVASYPQLHGFWRFCDNYEDSSIKGNHGTPVNGPPIVPIPDLPMGIFCSEDELWVIGTGGRICAGDTIPLLANAGGTNPPFSYQWYPDSTLLYSDTQNPLAFPRKTTSYIVVVTDQANNVARDTVTVIVNPELLIDAGEDIRLCGLQDVPLYCRVLNGAGPYTYYWTPASLLSATGIANPVASPAAPGNYPFIVRVTDANGCTAIDTVDVIVNPDVLVDAGPDIRMCGRRPVLLQPNIVSGTPPFTLDWQPDSSLYGSNPDSPLANPFQTTTYRVRVVDADSCIGEDSLTVFVFPELLGELRGDTSICKPDSVSLSLQLPQGSVPVSVEWSPQNSLDLSDIYHPRAFVSTSTTFSVKVTDANGCVFEDSVSVTIHPGVDFYLVSDTLLCEAGFVKIGLHVVSGQPPLIINWTNADSLTFSDEFNATAFAWRNSTYTVNVEDANGCVESKSTSITVVPRMTLALDSIRTICEGEDVSLNAIVSGGRKPYIVRWEPAARVANPALLSTSARCTGPETFTLHVTDLAGCEVIDSILVKLVPRPKPDAGPDKLICRGDTLLLNGSGVGGERPYTWKWSPDSSVIGISTDSTVMVAPTISTRYILSIQASNGCIARDTVFVTVEQLADVKIQPSGTVRLCLGDSLLLRATPGMARYEWVYNDTAVVGDGVQCTVSRPGHYSVRVWTINGCSGTIGSTMLIISQPPQPIITADRAVPICAGDTVRLRTTIPFARYEWLDDSGRIVSQGAVLASGSSGHYTVVVVDGLGCTGVSDPFEVQVLHLDAPVLVGESVACAGDTLEYSVYTQPKDSIEWAVDGGQVIWTTSSPAMIRVAWGNSNPARVRVVLRREVGSTGFWCSAETELEVVLQIIQPPVIASGSAPTICEGDSLQLSTAAGMSIYEWLTPEGPVVSSDSLVVRKAGSYRVRVTNGAGCTAISESFEVTVSTPPDIRILGPRVVCAGSEVRYSALNGGNAALLWSVQGGTLIGGETSDTIRVFWQTRGTGRIILRADMTLCPAADTITVTIADSLKPDIFPNGSITLCEGDSISLDAGVGYMSYRWTTPSGIFFTPVIVAKLPGEYSVFVQNAGGCQGSSDPILVSIHQPIPPLVTGPSDLCIGDTASLVATPGFILYQWSTGESGQKLRVSETGNYHVRVKDSLGCESISEAFQVVFHAPPGKPQITRIGDSLISSPADRYKWYFDGEEIPLSDWQIQAILGAGSYLVQNTNEFGCSSISDVFVVEQQRALTVVALPDVVAEPGDIVDIPLTLYAQANLDAVNVSLFNARVSFDASTLVPIEKTPQGIVSGGLRILDLERESWTGQTPLKTLRFMVTLGLADSTLLRIDNFDWDGAPVDVRTVNGTLRIRICREGGARLFDGSQMYALKQNVPNPVSATTTITYSVLTSGSVRLELTDLYGRSIKTLVDSYQEPGDYTVIVNVSDLSSGIYLYTLKSAVGALQRQLIVTH